MSRTGVGLGQKVMRKVAGRGSTRKWHQFWQNVGQYFTCAHLAEGGHFFRSTLPQVNSLGQGVMSLWPKHKHCGGNTFTNTEDIPWKIQRNTNEISWQIRTNTEEIPWQIRRNTGRPSSWRPLSSAAPHWAKQIINLLIMFHNLAIVIYKYVSHNARILI